MLSFIFSLVLSAAPMQSARPVAQEVSCVVAKWRTEIVGGKFVYVYRNDMLVFIMPLPL